MNFPNDAGAFTNKLVVPGLNVIFCWLEGAAGAFCGDIGGVVPNEKTLDIGFYKIVVF